MDNLQKQIIENRIPKDYLKKYYHNNIEEVLTPNIDLNTVLSNNTTLDIAVDIFKEVLNSNIPIIINGDIDVDGMTSAYIIKTILVNIFNIDSSRLKFIIGGRKYGRGVCDYILEEIDKKELDSFLLITADHGSTDEKAFKYLKEKYPKSKLIITDHHTVYQDNYPTSADVFFNTQEDKHNLSKDLCGCATIFILLYYVGSKIFNYTIKDYQQVIAYVGVATIVDVMSIRDPINRYLVKEALTIINTNPDANFTIIKKILKLTTVNYKDVSVVIGPYLNTANRLGIEKYLLVGLLVTDVDIKTKWLKYTQELNLYRKAETEMTIKEVLSSPDIFKNNYGKTIDINTKGMIGGSIASSISQTFQCPTICVSYIKSKNIYTGSGRAGLENVDILSILKDIKQNYPDILLTANGHKAACGVEISYNGYKYFKELFNQYAKEYLIKHPKKDIVPEFTITQNELNEHLCNSVMELSPYGNNFNPPIFTTKERFRIRSYIRIKNFYKLTLLLEDRREVEGLLFFSYPSKYNINLLTFHDMIKPGMYINILFHIFPSNLARTNSYQLEIVDIEPLIQGE